MPGVAEVFADAKRSDAEVPPSTCSVFPVAKADRRQESLLRVGYLPYPSKPRRWPSIRSRRCATN